jgi:hypothetical protein
MSRQVMTWDVIVSIMRRSANVVAGGLSADGCLLSLLSEASLNRI